jgi:hydrogenase maturation protein HypF
MDPRFRGDDVGKAFAVTSATIIPLPRRLPDMLGVGAFLKNTVCAVHGDRAVISPAIGNLDSAAAIVGFEGAVRDLVDALGLSPGLIAHDLHPDFYSTRWAQSQATPSLAVQHHHAHVAAVAAEHGHAGPLIGLALDGFGLGPGNQSWGGEMLLVDGAAYRRLGHLAHLPQPGGDLAARQPWRMAAAVLHRLGHGDQIATRFAAQPSAGRLAEVIARGLNCPPTSSAGRLFDAACGLLGVHLVAEFEGQAPIALEGMVSRPRVLAGGWTIADGVLDCLPLLAALIGRDAADGADLFHGTLVAALAEWAAEAAERSGISVVAMGGGCFFNKVLRQGLVEALAGRGLVPLLPVAASPGDPGVSLGQAWVAALAGERAG